MFLLWQWGALVGKQVRALLVLRAEPWTGRGIVLELLALLSGVVPDVAERRVDVWSPSALPAAGGAAERLRGRWAPPEPVRDRTRLLEVVGSQRPRDVRVVLGVAVGFAFAADGLVVGFGCGEDVGEVGHGCR